MEYSGRHILVTGGAGFIGSHLVDQLAREDPASIHVVDNLFLGREENLDEARRSFPALYFHYMDAGEETALRKLISEEGIEIVFNLATKALGYSFEDPADAFHVNVRITGHLLEALRLHKIQWLVQFSSSEVYGSALELPISESHPLLPMTPYAAGKAAADLMVRAYQETFDVRVLTLRPFNNYGPRQNDGPYAGVIPTTMTRLVRGEPPIISGTGDQTRDFMFVRDTARIAVELGRHEDLIGRVLNLGSSVEVSISDLIGRICDIAGYAGPVAKAPPRPGDVSRQCADVHAVREALGEIALQPLKDGLIETWDWYCSRVEKPKRGLAPSAR